MSLLYFVMYLCILLRENRFFWSHGISFYYYSVYVELNYELDSSLFRKRMLLFLFKEPFEKDEQKVFVLFEYSTKFTHRMLKKMNKKWSNKYLLNWIECKKMSKILLIESEQHKHAYTHKNKKKNCILVNLMKRYFAMVSRRILMWSWSEHKHKSIYIQ